MHACKLEWECKPSYGHVASVNARQPPTRDHPVHLVSSTSRRQADRRARTREALLEAAAKGISRQGYANLVLERVANDAGYSRGAIYHLFANKEELTLAVVTWIEEAMYRDAGDHFADETDPVATLLAIARCHDDYIRPEVPGVVAALRAEFGESDHPIGRALEDMVNRVVANTTRLITAGRHSGAIPPGPPPRTLALGFVGALDGVRGYLSGQAPFDVVLAERAARGVLGLPPQTGTSGTA